MSVDNEEMYLVMDDTFDEKAAKIECDSLSDKDKKIIKEILDKIH